MKKLNHYFQKGVIVFVIIMLITIPNLQHAASSSISSYQTSSPAITANNNRELWSNSKESPFIAGAICVADLIGGVVGLALIGAYVGTSFASGKSVAEIATDITSLGLIGVNGKSLSVSKNVKENYVKYDFSEFDN